MKIRIEFSKHGMMRYIGHLDMMRYFQKVIRRAEIDICYTEGFSPHQMMSFAHPLGVGVESDAEYLDIIVNSSYSSQEAKDRLNQTGADGIQVISYLALDESAKNAMSMVACADYCIGSKKDKNAFGGFWGKDVLGQKLEEFLAQDEINVIKKTKKSESLTNIKPWIVEAKVLNQPIFEDLSLSHRIHLPEEKLYLAEYLNLDYYNPNAPVIFLKALTGSQANLKPALFMEAFASFLGQEYDELSLAITRKEVYGNEGSDESPEFKPLKNYGSEIVAN